MNTPITATPDYRRVCALPRRVITTRDAEAARAELEPQLALHRDARFLRWQALALREARDNDGAVLWYPVGQGKTLICALLPRVMRSRSAVLLLPARLRGDAEDALRSYVGRWRLPNPPARIVSFEELTRENNADLLARLAPDLIVIDESHKIANTRSSVPVRIDRYLRASHDAGRRVRVVTLSGSPSRGDIMRFWHLVVWPLQAHAPLPLDESEAERWSDAIGTKAVTPRGYRPAPGVLGRDLESARAWVRDRLAQTPGVVVIDERSAASVPVTFRVLPAPDCDAIDAAYERFLERMESPDGYAVSDALSRYLLDSQLGSGLYSYPSPRPSDEWYEARRVFARFVRHTIARESSGCDTEAQVVRAYATHPAVRDWLAIRDEWQGRSEVQWISEATLDACVAWLRAAREPAIVWTGIVEFGRELARRAGLSYYASGGKDARGTPIRRADPAKHMVASWHACREGFNLQPWRLHLIAQSPTSSEHFEQLIGRAVRTGQDRAVHFDVLATSGLTYLMFERTRAETCAVRESTSLTQALAVASVEIVKPRSDAVRWAGKE